MDVGEDVILTEAVISGALAAIAELQVGIVGIRAAADGALVVIALLLGLFLLLLGRTLELHRLGPVAVGGAASHVVDLRPDEHGEVQQRDDRQQRAAQFPASRQRTTSKANMAASRYASHFMRMGMKKNSSTWVLGNRNAKAKNMDRFT